jgi:hypothetical protein
MSLAFRHSKSMDEQKINVRICQAIDAHSTMSSDSSRSLQSIISKPTIAGFLVVCRSFSTTVNEQRYPLGHTPNGIPKPWTRRKLNVASAKRLALFHYVTRSLEDFQIKSARAGGDGVHKPLTFFESMERCVPLATLPPTHFCVAHPNSASL